MSVSDWTESELIELYEERAAIAEFDGGLSREQAEQQAYFGWRQIVGPGVPVPATIQKLAKKFRKPPELSDLWF